MEGKRFVAKAGDVIFFNWDVDGKVNHIGIVEKVKNKKIYTIESKLIVI